MSDGVRLNVGIYAHSIRVSPQMTNNVSGHAQAALEAAGRLRAFGCNVHLFTTTSDRGYTELPVIYPPGIPLDVLAGEVQRQVSIDGGANVATVGPANFRAAYSLMRSLAAGTRKRRLDVLHSFGSPRSAALAAQATRFGWRGLSAATIFHPVESRIDRLMMSKVDAIFSSSDTVADSLPADWTNVYRVRHGLTKRLSGAETASPRDRVLFWREATSAAGADLVLAAFDRLAPAYPQYAFDLLLRDANVREVPGVEDLAARHHNVHVHRFPYPDGISLERYLSEALCVVLPFRKTTFNPQLAVLESIAAGAPTVTTRVGSNHELWEQPDAKLLPRDPTVGELYRAIEACLHDPAAARASGVAHARWVRSVWTWSRFGEDTVDAYRRERSRRGPTHWTRSVPS